jgi:tRNA isopentenyl-2-thiomethyl-A-37 hydroxylase MiaE
MKDEFAEARDLLKQAENLTKKANDLTKKANDMIRAKAKARYTRWIKTKDHQKLTDLATRMPDCVERFYAFLAASEAKQTK